MLKINPLTKAGIPSLSLFLNIVFEQIFLDIIHSPSDLEYSRTIRMIVLFDIHTAMDRIIRI